MYIYTSFSDPELGLLFSRFHILKREEEHLKYRKQNNFLPTYPDENLAGSGTLLASGTLPRYMF